MSRVSPAAARSSRKSGRAPAQTRSIRDSAETSKAVCDSEADRLDSGPAMIRYIAWAIPAIGFLGTVVGLARALIAPAKPPVQEGQSADQMLAEYTKQTDAYLSQVTEHLGSAFDCTFIALALSLGLMYMLHTVQKAEETLVIDCQNYCQEHLLLRLYDPGADG